MLRILFVLTFTTIAFQLSGCGVRGKPQPPLTPAELGRGQTTFKRATEEFAFPEVPNPEAPPATPTSRAAGGGTDR